VSTLTQGTEGVEAGGAAQPDPDMPNPLRDPQDRRLPRIAGPCGLVIFGVTGDLSRKKLMPAIYDLANRGLLPPGFALVGFARRDYSDQDFTQVVHDAVKEHCAHAVPRGGAGSSCCEGFRFVQGDFTTTRPSATSRARSRSSDESRGTGGNHAFYLSVPPSSFPLVVQQLQEALPRRQPRGSWRRVVIEKPFGHDLASAQELQRVVGEVFPTNSVFRIDHYLARRRSRTSWRCASPNSMFEPVWNRSYVDHVQITMAEDIGIGGRAGYYDGIGAARDVIQNHLLQLLALTAMEEPVSFNAADLRQEKMKVSPRSGLPADLDADTARGQYAAAGRAGARVKGFLDEEGIPPTRAPRPTPRSSSGSTRGAGPACRSTYAPASGWAGASQRSPVVFQRAPHLPFTETASRSSGQNALVDPGASPTRASPCGSVQGARAPRWRSATSRWTSRTAAASPSRSPEAYERLILDVLLGRPAAVPSARGGRALLEHPRPDRGDWAENGRPSVPVRDLGSRRRPTRMLARDGRVWRRP
jgi:glucose-6-phosphate 1-dehydrogenase